MAEGTYENLTLELRRNDDQGVYEVGYVLNGAFILLQRQKIAHVEKAVSRYEEEQAQKPSEPEPEPEPQPQQTPTY